MLDAKFFISEPSQSLFQVGSTTPIKGDPFWNVGNMQSSNAAILQSANLYVYTVNNPVRWVDPSGLAKEPTFKSIHYGSGGVVLGMGALMAVNSMTRGHESMAARAAAATDTIAAAVVDTGRNAARALTNLYRAVTDAIARPSPPEALPAVGSSTVTSVAITGTDVQVAIDRAIARAGTADECGEPFRFMAATIPHINQSALPGIIPSGIPLTMQGAIDHINSIELDTPWQGVIAFSQLDAYQLAKKFGGPIISRWQPETRLGVPGFFWHYHPAHRSEIHIWFPTWR